MFTVLDVMNSWGSVDINKMLKDYRLESWDSKNGERYIIESATNSGLMVSVKGKVKMFISGVSYEKYYNEELNLSFESDLKKVLEDLFKKEKLNKDRLSNFSIFIDDLALRNKSRYGVGSK